MSGTETQSDLIHSELGDPEAFGEIVDSSSSSFRSDSTSWRPS